MGEGRCEAEEMGKVVGESRGEKWEEKEEILKGQVRIVWW